MSKSSLWIITVEMYLTDDAPMDLLGALVPRSTITHVVGVFRSREKAIRTTEKALGFSVPWNVTKTPGGTKLAYSFYFDEQSISFAAPGIRHIHIGRHDTDGAFYVKYAIRERMEQACHAQEIASREISADDE